MKLSEQLRDAGLEEMAERADKLESAAWLAAFNNACEWRADYDTAREHADKQLSEY